MDSPLCHRFGDGGASTPDFPASAMRLALSLAFQSVCSLLQSHAGTLTRADSRIDADMGSEEVGVRTAAALGHV